MRDFVSIKSCQHLSTVAPKDQKTTKTFKPISDTETNHFKITNYGIDNFILSPGFRLMYNVFNKVRCIVLMKKMSFLRGIFLHVQGKIFSLVCKIIS